MLEQIHGFTAVELVREHFGTPGGFRNVRGSAADSNPGRRVLADAPDGSSAVIHVTLVSGRNAGSFRGWLKYSRADWRRVQSPIPDGFSTYTLMVGMDPSDEQPWWLAMYDERVVQTLQPEAMEQERWYRIDPTQAATARIGGDVDLRQLTLFVKPGDGSPPDDTEHIRAAIWDGIDVLLDNEAMKRLSTEQVRLIEEAMPRVLAQLNKWSRVRVAQSYSRQKHDARAKR